MQEKDQDHVDRASEIDEELVDVLTAISVVSKRLARKLAAILRQETNRKEDEQDERTVTADR